MNAERHLEWTPALIERFWRAAYAHDLAPVREARRQAPFLAALISARMQRRAKIVELGSRDGELASYLVRAGHRVGRLPTGPLLAPVHEAAARDPRWLGDLTLGEGRSADLVVAADVISRLLDHELAGFFAAARLMMTWTGLLCITTRNSESAASGLSVCPVTGKIFNGGQRLRSFGAEKLAALLAREGFAPVAVVQAELDAQALKHHSSPPLEALAQSDAFIGNGETLAVFARLERWPHADDVTLAGEWLASRVAAARATPDPEAAPFEWTEESSRKFWSSIRGTPLEEESFGAQVGSALLAIVEPWLVEGGRHLDMGAGGGDVADLLLSAGYPVAALEASDGRRAGIEHRLGGRPNFLGALHTLDEIEPFDVVLASEVIEHVPPEDDGLFLNAIKRALKPDGVLVVSTPADEDRSEAMQYSPAGDVIYHRWQHVRSFSAEGLKRTLSKYGFRCDVIYDVDFSAVARGAAPFFETILARTQSRTIGAGGTLIAVARPRALAPHALPPSPRRLLRRRIPPPRAYAPLIADGWTPFEDVATVAPASPSPQENLALSMMKLLGAAYENVSPPLRRLLPAAIKARLSRFAPALERALAPLAQRKLAQTCIRLSECAALLPRQDFHGGAIVLVNNALAWGGVERQVVNTLRGLERRTQRDLGLLCLKLGEGGDYAFYLPALAGFRGFVRDMTPFKDARTQLAALFSDDAIAHTTRVIGWMPGDVQENILRLMADFAVLRPAVVHAWQDALSIEAAFAAKLVGVPRIITSARNMSPPNFAYFRPHQRDGYREIAACDDIVMLANSAAGASDYADWLGIATQRFGVLRNGVDVAAIHHAPEADVARLRAQLEIPDGAQIIGSIFRFYPEKQPLLWMEVAAEVAARVPLAHFVIFGTGPMLQQARDYAAAYGFADRFHTPGTISDAALGLSLLDVFLLTSKFEGTPNVVLEASAIGVPVVAAPAGGAAEAVEEDATGWIVNPPHANVMANRVCQALGDAAWREACRARARDFVAERFGLDRMIAETLDLYGLEEVRGGQDDVLHRTPERIAGE